MAEEYFCTRDCFCNNQYFHGGRFYDEDLVFKGLDLGMKSETSKYLLPMDKDEITEEQLKLLRIAIDDAVSLVKTLENFGGGQMSAVRQTETHRKTAKTLRALLKKSA